MKTSWYAVSVACLSLLALGWLDNARGPFFPILLTETGVSSANGSFFFALTSFLAVLSSAFAGWFLQKYRVKYLLIAGGFVMGASPLVLAMVPSFYGAMGTAFVFGCCFGWITVGQNVMIGKFADVRVRSKLFSLLHCFYALSALVAPLTIIYMKSRVPWNWLLCGVTLLCVPLVLMGLFVKEDKIEPKVLGSGSPEGLRLFNWDIFQWIIFLSFYISAELMLSTRLVVLMRDFNFGYDFSAHTLAGFFIFMFVSRFFFFLFKLKVSDLILLTLSVGASLFCFVVFYFTWAPGIALCGLFMGPVFPFVMEYLSKKMPENFDVLVARIIAISSLFVVCCHLALGKFSDLWGVKLAMLTVPFLLLPPLILVFLELDQRHLKSKPGAPST